MVSSATWRLALRAVAVGLTTLLVQLQQSSSWDKALIESAVVAGVLAALEVVTPANPNVGVKAKHQPAVKP